MISPSGHYLRPEYLKHLAKTCCNGYTQAKPFPHAVIDNFLSVEVLDRVLDEFPGDTAFDWQTTDGIVEGKTLPKADFKVGETTHRLLQQLNSTRFIRFLEQLTDTHDIMADPVFVNDRVSGHCSTSKTCLKFPSDAHHYAKQYLDRKLTLLLYLNKDWKEEYGGHLELWNAEMTHCEKRILPIFNRCVIFSTTNFSYYGHPEPLNCPDGVSRKLLALSYYSQPDRSQLHPQFKEASPAPLRLVPEGQRKSKNNVLVFRSTPSSTR